jgi:hypothetical protein
MEQSRHVARIGELEYSRNTLVNDCWRMTGLILWKPVHKWWGGGCWSGSEEKCGEDLWTELKMLRNDKMADYSEQGNETSSFLKAKNLLAIQQLLILKRHFASWNQVNKLKCGKSNLKTRKLQNACSRYFSECKQGLCLRYWWALIAFPNQYILLLLRWGDTVSVEMGL